jgi:agmatinase
MIFALTRVLFVLATANIVIAHGSHNTEAEDPKAQHVESSGDPWLTEFGPTPDLSFSGVNTFAHLPHAKCLIEPEKAFDIALLGIPFDSAVSYRPGARFGPYALRAGRSLDKVHTNVQDQGDNGLTGVTE